MWIYISIVMTANLINIIVVTSAAFDVLTMIGRCL